ncbi:MAG: hypothetical protein NVS3B17_20010 [Vulcanimicrobiaceae bacterium]
MPPRKIMIVRHGEKPTQDGVPPFGVDETGATDFHSLSVRGWQRAGALVEFFKRPRYPEKISTPKYIYAAAPAVKDGASPHGVRAIQTVTPLAAALPPGMKPTATWGLFEEDRLATELRSLDGDVLIAWEHKRISVIVRELCPNNTAVPEWDGRRFDLVWVLDLNGETYGDPTVVAQALLDGDMPP